MALFMALLVCGGTIVAGGSIDHELQMAWLTEWPIGLLEALGKPKPEEQGMWTRVSQLDLESYYVGEVDHFSLSKSASKMCVIAISGTNAVTDFQENLNLIHTDYCGFSDVHSGVAKELDDLIQSSNWTETWLPVLNSNECSAGVYVTGHSLGGAQASLLAACANNGSTPYGFEVQGLYTYGAFAPSKVPLTNRISAKQKQREGCFGGARYFNQDSGNFDIVPATTTNAGFRHPQVKALMLSRRYSWVREAPLEVYQYRCDTQCAALYPTDQGSFSLPSVVDHSMGGAYLERLLDLHNKSRKVDFKIHDLEACKLGDNPLANDANNNTEADGARNMGVPLSLLILSGAAVIA